MWYNDNLKLAIIPSYQVVDIHTMLFQLNWNYYNTQYITKFFYKTWYHNNIMKMV